MTSSNKKDEEFGFDLKRSLTSLCRNLGLSIELSTELEPGSNIYEGIRKRIKRRDLVICLISSDFLVEFEIFQSELQNLPTSKILPIMTRKTSTSYTWLRSRKLFDCTVYNDRDTILHDLEKMIEHKLENLHTTNRIQVRAGFGESNVILKSDVENTEELELEVVGDSMFPEFKNEDIIKVKKIDNFEDIKPNEFYVVDSKQFGLVLKQIQYENAVISLISINETVLPMIIKNPQEDVLGIWIVKNMSRKFNQKSS